MCTATWITRPAGFELFFNRDERRERALADAPRLVRTATGHAITPRDGDHGGTWIGVNSHGVALALLNRYDDAPGEEPGVGEHPAEESDRVSRGLIPLRLLAARSVDDALECLTTDDLSSFRPFDLLLFEPGAPPRRATWSGEELRVTILGDADRPVVSTSFRETDVCSVRRSTYDTVVGSRPDAQSLSAFHRSHEPRRGPASPCMHREDAETVSMSRISVGPDRVLFRYAAGPPCRTPLDETGLSITRERSDRGA